jgi:hypothetical protein
MFSLKYLIALHHAFYNLKISLYEFEYPII